MADNTEIYPYPPDYGLEAESESAPAPSASPFSTCPIPGIGVQFCGTHEPQMSFHWRIKEFQDNSFLIPFVEKISIPWQRYEATPIYTSGTNSYYHSVNDIDPISITFYSDTDLTVMKAMQNWIASVQDSGYYGLPSEYKKRVVLVIIHPVTGAETGTVTMDGLWPSAIANQDYSFSESNRISIDVTFQIDNLALTFNTTVEKSPTTDGTTVVLSPGSIFAQPNTIENVFAPSKGLYSAGNNGITTYDAASINVGDIPFPGETNNFGQNSGVVIQESNTTVTNEDGSTTNTIINSDGSSHIIEHNFVFRPPGSPRFSFETETFGPADPNYTGMPLPS